MKCIECDSMLCKTFQSKQEKWEGFCILLKRIVDGDESCKVIKQGDLFSNE